MAELASPERAESRADAAQPAIPTRQLRRRARSRGHGERGEHRTLSGAYRPRSGDWTLAATITWDVLSTLAFFGLLRIVGVVPALVGAQSEAISVFARPLPVIFACVAPFVIGAFGGYAARGPASAPLSRLSRLVAAAAI